MTQDLRVAMTTSLNDRLVGPLRRALDEIEKNLKSLEKELGGVTQGSNQAGQALGAMQGPAQAAKQVTELAKQTQNAIGLADKLKNAWSTAGNTIKGITTAVGAFQAAKYVMSAPLEKARSYEKQLADAANIAYDYGDRKRGMAEMNESVVGAVRAGGGNRESALKGMNDLYAANIDKDVVKSLLPTMQKYATAGNADPANIAQLVIYGLRSLKLDPKDIGLMLDKTLQSTKGGSMEFDSLSKWMPQIGAAGGAAGLTGMKGYEQMLAGVQTSRLTAGTKDEAGTNFKDLLSLINGHALMTAAHRIGIDAAGSIAKHIGGGGNALSGTVALADYVADHDPRFSALQKQLNATQKVKDAKGTPIYSPEQEDIMRQQAALFAGSALGKLFHNQQSMQALVALRNNRDYFKDNLASTAKATGQVVGQDYETIQATSEYKHQQAENEKLFALTDGLNPVNTALGKLDEKTTELYQKYPGYATTVETAKLAISGLAAAAGGAGLALLALGGGKGAGAAVGGAVTKTAVATATGVSAALPLVATGMVVGGVVLGAGMAMSNQLNSDEGLRGRVDSRQARLAELNEMASLTRDAGGSTEKYDAEIKVLREDRDNLLTKLVGQEEVAREIRALNNRPIQLTVDGQVLATTVNNTNAAQARRN